MRIALLALLIAAPPVLAGPNHVYVYGSPNRSMECPLGTRFYVDTVGQGFLAAQGCVTLWLDWQWWPSFQPLNIRVQLEGGFKVPVTGTCLFVAHANNGDNTTSTVIDCR